MPSLLLDNSAIGAHLPQPRSSLAFSSACQLCYWRSPPSTQEMAAGSRVPRPRLTARAQFTEDLGREDNHGSEVTQDGQRRSTRPRRPTIPFSPEAAGARRRREAAPSRGERRQAPLQDEEEEDEGLDIEPEPPDLLLAEAVEVEAALQQAEPEGNLERVQVEGPREGTRPNRLVRGVEPGEKGSILNRLDPEVPAASPGPVPLDDNGWNQIDRVGAWDCVLNPFHSMEDVPRPHREKWTQASEKILREVLRSQQAEDQINLDRALKWWLILPAVLLRQAKRGGQAGRNSVAARFNAIQQGDWGSLIHSYLDDKSKAEERRRRRTHRRAQPEKGEGEIRRHKRKVALSLLAKGQVSKAVARLTSHGVASTDDPAVMAALREKYPPRSRPLPASVTIGQPVDSLTGLKEQLSRLPPGVAPGTGGFRPEFLTCLAEVMEEEQASLLEDFGLLYLSGKLPPWYYKVGGSVTTVPVYKTKQRNTLRPVGVKNPLTRVLHRAAIIANREPLNAFLEPQQLCLSSGGAHKLVNSVRMMSEANPNFIVVKLDFRNAHNEISRAAIIEELETEPSLQHLAWLAAVVLAPHTGLEAGGALWGLQGEGEVQGDPLASACFAVAIQRDVRALDKRMAAFGGMAKFGNDDGYIVGPPEKVFQALEEFSNNVRQRCSLHLQESKTEVFAWGELPAVTPPTMKRAGIQEGSSFHPGFLCYGIPVGSNTYVRAVLEEKAKEISTTAEEVASILGEDAQALWVVLHRSLSNKLDYHLTLCYPSDIRPVAAALDRTLWAVLEQAAGQKIPRWEQGLGYECVLNPPIDSMTQLSFQELFIRTPIRQKGFGLRSMLTTCPAAFIGGVEKSLPMFSGEQGICRQLQHQVGDGGMGEEWWRTLQASNCRTGREFTESWTHLQMEGAQCANYLGIELGGLLAKGPAHATCLQPDSSCRQELTEQREELKEAVLKEALLQHPDQAARPVRFYPQLDRLSSAWKLSLPGPVNGLPTKVFREVMATHLFLPSPACKDIMGQPVIGQQPAGPFGDEVMCATLPGDSWRTRHDSLKTCLMNILEDAKVPAEAEVYGLFRHLIPAEALAAGGPLEQARQRMGLTPDLRIRFPTAEGPQDLLGEIKLMSAGRTRYPLTRMEKQADRRARELPATYRRPLARLDEQYHGTQAGAAGPLVRHLQSFGELQCYVGGAFGEGSAHLHSLIQSCAEARIQHLIRLTGQQDMERFLGTIVGQYRREISTCIVRAQALCLLSRIGQISPAARAAAQRRAGAARLERQRREERRAQWAASLQGPGWARRGESHTLPL